MIKIGISFIILILLLYKSKLRFSQDAIVD